MDVKEELDLLKKSVPFSCKNIILLVKQYLKCDGWPKPLLGKSAYEFDAGYNNGFNEALELCKLAHLKSLPTEEQIEDLIYETIIYPCKVRNPFQYVKDCSEAISKLIRGEK